MADTLFVDGVTASAAAWANDVNSNVYGTLSSVSGTNTILATGPLSLTAYASGNLFRLTPAVTNTGATTLNVSSLGAKNVFSGGAACIGGELVAGVPVFVHYDGTQFQIIGNPITKGTSASTFTFDGSGGTSGSVTMTYQKIGNMVTLNIPAVLATSGTSSVNLVGNTALPAAIRPPSTTQVQSANAIANNGGSDTSAGIVQVSTGGIITINRTGAGTPFTNSSSCGLNAPTTIIYFVG